MPQNWQPTLNFRVLTVLSLQVATGAVFEVLNGLYEQPKSARIPLGLLPIGTGEANSTAI
jgi:hypothetical protein